nr:SDR family oxidoreductase [Akkermansiaceae bacterium]
DAEGHIADDKWGLTFEVNVTGLYIVADEANRIWEQQGLPGSLVLTTSVNSVVSKRDSMAYDTSKAAANHLVRELAVELAPLVRVNGLAPATVVRGSAMFPRETVIASLEKYEVDYDEDENTDSLRNRLARCYADRTLTGEAVTPEDCAEAAYLLASERLGRTTGQIITVDGGGILPLAGHGKTLKRHDDMVLLLESHASPAGRASGPRGQASSGFLPVPGCAVLLAGRSGRNGRHGGDFSIRHRAKNLLVCAA